MTRINCGIIPAELEKPHLIAEHREIKRVPNCVAKGRYNLKGQPKHLGMGAKEMTIGVIIDGKECTVGHNYGTRNTYGKKYTKLNMPYGSPNYDIDLFVRLEIEKPAKSKEPKQLKKFSYKSARSNKKRYYVLAWTNKEAIELFESIGVRLSPKDLRDYVSKTWGNDGEAYLKDVDQTQSAVYEVALTEFNDNIKQDVVPIKLK